MMKYTRLRDDVKGPQRKTVGSAGWDLCAGEAVTLEPHRTVRVPTGLAFEIGRNFMGLILIRSSMSDIYNTKHPPIDSDYRGEVHIILHNTTEYGWTVGLHERIAQLVIVPCYPNELVEVPFEELSTTIRGAGGFGSTD